MNFEMYRKPAGMSAIYYRVPIDELDEFRKVMASQGQFYKIRYRGPRAGDNRSWNNRQSTCLKSRATCFSAYYY